MLVKCMKLFPKLVEKIKADDRLKQKLLKELSEIDRDIGEIQQVFEQKEPDKDEFEQLMTDLSEETIQKI